MERAPGLHARKEGSLPHLIDGRLVDEEGRFHHIISDVFPLVGGHADPGVFVDAPPFPSNLAGYVKKRRHRHRTE